MRDGSSSGWWGGGLMCGIKIPQQNFALKMQGGGVFAGHYSTSFGFKIKSTGACNTIL